MVGGDGDKVNLAVDVDLLDAHDRPEPFGASDQDGSGHDGGGIGGVAEQTPPAALIVFGVEIGSQIDPFRMGTRLGG
jgi:hypothetical protein